MKITHFLLILFVFWGFACEKEEPPLPYNVTVDLDKYHITFTIKGINIESYDVNYGGNPNYIETFDPKTYGYEDGINGSHSYTQDGEYEFTIIGHGLDGKSYIFRKKITVDYFAKNGLLADFTANIIDGSCVQVTNKAKPETYPIIYLSTPGKPFLYRSYYKNPLICPEFNGEYIISQETSEGNRKQENFIITNAHLAYVSTMEGTINDEPFSHYENYHQPQTSYGYQYLFYGPDKPFVFSFISSDFTWQNQKYNLSIQTNKTHFDAPEGVTQEGIYKAVKEKLQVGKQPIGYYDNGWLLYLRDGIELRSISEGELEILEVTEIKLQPIIPEMYEKGFLVKAKINLKPNHPSIKQFDVIWTFKYRMIFYPHYG